MEAVGRQSERCGGGGVACGEVTSLARNVLPSQEERAEERQGEATARGQQPRRRASDRSNEWKMLDGWRRRRCELGCDDMKLAFAGAHGDLWGRFPRGPLILCMRVKRIPLHHQLVRPFAANAPETRLEAFQRRRDDAHLHDTMRNRECPLMMSADGR